MGPLPDARKGSIAMKVLALALGALLLGSPLGIAQAEGPRPARAPTELAYGANPLQRLDFWPGSRARMPLILFIHGGGWSDGDKADSTGSAAIGHFTAEGHAFASTNYRLAPESSVEEQAQDVADAVAFLVARADRLGIARDRIILMGHSSGGHLAALIATDTAYLRQAGFSTDIVSGVVLLDGAALAPPTNRSNPIFGSDEARRKRLAPINHVAAPNARRFLMLNAGSADLARQAKAFAEGLRAAGTPARVEAVANTNHMQLVDKLGTANDPATRIVDAFIGEASGSGAK